MNGRRNIFTSASVVNLFLVHDHPTDNIHQARLFATTALGSIESLQYN